MKRIATESFSLPCSSEESLRTLIERGEAALRADHKQPLRLIVLDLSKDSVSFLASVIYEKSS